LPVGHRPPTARSRSSARAAADRSRKRWRAPTWAELAACAGQTNLFFGNPVEGDPERIDRERSALAVCAVCPVLTPCRDHARQYREAGIWGGENDVQRRVALKLDASAVSGSAVSGSAVSGSAVSGSAVPGAVHGPAPDLGQAAPIAATGTESSVPAPRRRRP
jgi:WhiB family transcriptional regulator, redox-sensing transcriptional regulator